MKKITGLLCALGLFSWATLAQQSAAPTPPEWQDIPQSSLVYLDLPQGTLVLVLADAFAPGHTARFRELVKTGFYDGLSFYRVIDQFVFQAGLPESEVHPVPALQKSAGRWPALQAEFSWPVRPSDKYMAVQKPELLAEETGFNQGFAVGRGEGLEWLLNCPLTINMARSAAANSATTDFALMRGQAPRHLDRNMSVFAKVIWGAELLNQIKLGDVAKGGVIADPQQRTRILKATLGVDRAPAQQLTLQWQDSQSAAFQAMVQQRRERANEFFHYKGNGALDICYIQVPVRLKPSGN